MLSIQNDGLFYVDSVSLRTSFPIGYNDDLLLKSRRIFPKFLIDQKSLNVTKQTSMKFFSFQPLNCVFNITKITIVQNVSVIYLVYYFIFEFN